MNYKNRLLYAVLSVTMAVSMQTAVFADYEQVGSNGIKITGEVACKGADKIIGIDVYAPDKDISDLKAETDKTKYTDILVYRDQLITGKNGEYEVKFTLNSGKPSGFYNYHIYCPCGETKITDTFFFCDPDKNKKALEELEKKKTAQEVLDYYNGKDENGELNKYKLGFVYDYELDLYSAELICSYVQGDGFDSGDKAGSIAAFKKAVVMSQISKGTISDLFDYGKELDIADSRINQFMDKSFVTEGFKTSVTAKLKGASADSFDEFWDEIYESFVLTTVKSPDGWKNIQLVASEFENEIGLENGVPGESACVKVQNKEYSDYDALKTALESKKTTGGGNGGGGSSYSSVGGNKFSDDYVKGEEAESIPMEIFTDISDVEWAKDSIVSLAELGIINGKEPQRFYPNDNITREECTKLIAATFLSDEQAAEISFIDVPEDAWFAEYVKKAYGCGVIKGVSEDMFGTGSYITREDMAVIAYRAAIVCGLMEDTEINSEIVFEDDAQISDYARIAVYRLAEEEIINGIGDDYFAPKSNLTRAQAAKIIYGIYTIKQ